MCVVCVMSVVCVLCLRGVCECVVCMDGIYVYDVCVVCVWCTCVVCVYDVCIVCAWCVCVSVCVGQKTTLRSQFKLSPSCTILSTLFAFEPASHSGS